LQGFIDLFVEFRRHPGQAESSPGKDDFIYLKSSGRVGGLPWKMS